MADDYHINVKPLLALKARNLKGVWSESLNPVLFFQIQHANQVFRIKQILLATYTTSPLNSYLPDSLIATMAAVMTASGLCSATLQARPTKQTTRVRSGAASNFATSLPVVHAIARTVSYAAV